MSYLGSSSFEVCLYYLKKGILETPICLKQRNINWGNKTKVQRPHFIPKLLVLFSSVKNLEVYLVAFSNIHLALEIYR